jgi:predicted PurR-regulated permease PerM
MRRRTLLVALAGLVVVVAAGAVAASPRQSQPSLVGFAIALGLVAMIELGSRFFRRHPLTRKQLSAFFLCGAVLFLVGAVFLAGERVWWATGLLLVEFAVLVWVAVGNWFEWPGFRPEPDPDEEDGDDGSLASQSQDATR